MDALFDWSGLVRKIFGNAEHGSTGLIILLSLAFGGSTGFVYKVARALWRSSQLTEKRKRKQQSHRQALQNLQGLLRENEESLTRHLKDEEILSLPLCELATKLQAGEVTAAEVLHCYQGKALEVNKDVNCLVEPLWEATPRALELDHETKKKGPLHGIPVSLKDNYGVEGYDCTIGCANWIDQPFAEDAVIVKVLKKQGAIPFVKTNVPQTMISFDCSNPIFGQTTNPHDVRRVPGGSSGGEAALIASGGSLLGFGSDIGGSLRIPSSFCGICCLKPTCGRLSTGGTHPLYKGQTNIMSSLGPMARDVDTLVLAMRSLLVPYMFELDEQVPPIPFRDEIFEEKRPLRIGYYTYDEAFHAVPACQRAVEMARQALQRQGHELVPWTPPRVHDIMYQVFGNSMFGDGGDQLCSLLENDKVDNALKLMVYGLRPSKYIKKFISFILGIVMPDLGRVAKAGAGLKNVTAWWKLSLYTQKLKAEVAASWKSHRLDAVICPGFACQALLLGGPAQATGSVSYTATYNALDFPAGSLPVTKVTADDEAKMASYPTPNMWHKTIKKHMEGSTGLPVNVQVVALPWQEERCLRVMKDLEQALKLPAKKKKVPTATLR